MRSLVAVGLVTLALLALFFVAAPTLASGQQAGPKVIKDGKLDLIKLHVATLAPGADVPVMMRRFSTEGANLGTGAEGGKESRIEEAKKMQKDGPDILATEFAARLTKLGPYAKVTTIVPEDAVPPEAIVVEGKFVQIDPGSRAARYFGGFGAGKSQIAIEGTVKDGTGKLLAEFAQKRVGAMGAFGGDSLEKMTDDTKRVGEDLANFLGAWARGKSLK
jgi:hypothetical protein